MVAFRPDVEIFGFVLPSRNLPHSGWPYFAQPAGSVASAARSFQPMPLPGQPSASAIGFGIATTSGAFAIGCGSPSGTIDALSALALTRSRLTQPNAAGDQTSGRGPSTASFQPLASASLATPDDLLFTTTSTQCPATVRPLYAFADSCMMPNFSGDETTFSVTASDPLHFGAASP